MSVTLVSGVKEMNGKTIRQNNLERRHTLPLDTLVELDLVVSYANGTTTEGRVQMYVFSHDRDCDGTPLYGLATWPWSKILACHDDALTLEQAHAKFQNDRMWAATLDGFFRLKYVSGYDADSLTVVG
jgi:hypothetical protein